MLCLITFFVYVHGATARLDAFAPARMSPSCCWLENTAP